MNATLKVGHDRKSLAGETEIGNYCHYSLYTEKDCIHT